VAQIVSPRVPGTISLRETSIRRHGVVRILAIRVKFVPDTLSTTTGDGNFDYGHNDTMYFDPPPHDGQYFSDHLSFNDFYWQKMSNGAIRTTWDIFPEGNTAAYQLPKKMWQYNYNYPSDIDSLALDRGLANLFKDAIRAADADTAVRWTRYDLVIIFHAGAGTEFDLGFSETPHDIPSALMVKEDFKLLPDFQNGIPVDDHGARITISEGLILPETETHGGVQISMAGVLVFLFGHYLGLPALYDRDDGSPVVGKWSMMDRGFGNFYGSIPGPIDAWSRSFMGWLTPPVIAPRDSIPIAAFGTAGPDSLEARIVRITAHEYFLLECRYCQSRSNRDSVAVAFDREERRMVYREDYSVECDPGFRVPVYIDNLDFDSPGSGILIWHVDETLAPLLDDGRFNSEDNRRGLDLEECDGAQDIGRDYPFLTPGYGTDYGICDDAWYLKNPAHLDANHRDNVSFSHRSYPNSRANSGAWTGIIIDKFSRKGTGMTFSYSRSGAYFASPIEHDLGAVPVAVGNFDNDAADDEFALIGNRTVIIYDGDGSIIQSIDFDIDYDGWHCSEPAVRDLDGDGLEEIIWFAHGSSASVHMHVLLSNGSEFKFETVDHWEGPLSRRKSVLFAFGGEEAGGSVLLAVFPRDSTSVIRTYDSRLDRTIRPSLDGKLISLHRYGSISSDSFLIVTENELYLWDGSDSEFKDLGSFEFDWDTDRTEGTDPILVDIDASGEQDLIVLNSRGEGVHTVIIDPVDYIDTEIRRIKPIPARPGFSPVYARAADIDLDNGYELIGSNGEKIVAIEINGVPADNFPLKPPVDKGMSTRYQDCYITDLNGDSEFEIICRTYMNGLTEEVEEQRRIDGFTMDGHCLPGFPLVEPVSRDQTHMRFCQLDSLPGLELLMVSDRTIEAYTPDFSGEGAEVWWGQRYRDNDHSNAIWKSAEPFTPADVSILMPEDRCYNWPNPARDETNFRYFLNHRATVDLDVYDILGERVAYFHQPDRAAGQHHEIYWNLSNIARGIYVAVVKAEGNGLSETRLIKVAVVK